MSLKGFHIVFIVFAMLLSFGFCAWTVFGPAYMVTPVLKIVGIVSGVAGIVLVVYGVKFIKKTKHLIV